MKLTGAAARNDRISHERDGICRDLMNTEYSRVEPGHRYANLALSSTGKRDADLNLRTFARSRCAGPRCDPHSGGNWIRRWEQDSFELDVRLRPSVSGRDGTLSACAPRWSETPHPGSSAKTTLPVLVWPRRRRFRALVTAADRAYVGSCSLQLWSCANRSAPPRARLFGGYVEIAPRESRRQRQRTPNPWPQGRLAGGGRNRG